MVKNRPKNSDLPGKTPQPPRLGTLNKQKFSHEPSETINPGKDNQVLLHSVPASGLNPILSNSFCLFLPSLPNSFAPF
jgi:hypothetical protein